LKTENKNIGLIILNMSLNGHLTLLSKAAIVREREREQIDTSVRAIQQRIKRHFGDAIVEQKVFGSYARKTMLPRFMDDGSDVDLMIIFKDDGSKPQTHIERLRRFAEKWYPHSARSQSSPTFALDLQHVRFELVPAIEGWWRGIKIPAPRSEANDWLETDPDSFSRELESKNKSNNSLIKPLCRIMKFWNIQMGRPYESYALEQMIVAHGYQRPIGALFYGKWDMWQYFNSFAQKLIEMSIYEMPPVEERAVTRLQTALSKIDQFNRAEDQLNAENVLRRMLPLKMESSRIN
jgi:predicted nucleotidyltransferase